MGYFFRSALLLSAIIYAGCSAETGTSAAEFDVIIGTYNEPREDGIQIYRFNAETGELTFKSSKGGIQNPSYLAMAPDSKTLYAVSEYGSEGADQVYAYQYNRDSGELSLLNQVSSAGQGPCYVSIDASGSYLFAANYGNGSLGATAILDGGLLDSTIQRIEQQESGRESHLHSAVLSPDNKYLITSNLGIDQIRIYPFNPKKGEPSLSEQDAIVVSLPQGTGPRHFVFHPREKHGYLIGELDGSVTVFDYAKGELIAKQRVSILPENFEGTFGAADIHISPDGRFLYASNRIDLNEIVIFKIDAGSGKLTYTGRQSTLGKLPRGFAIDPSGNFILVGNQKSNTLQVFRRNPDSGLLSPLPSALSINGPVCVKFVN